MGKILLKSLQALFMGAFLTLAFASWNTALGQATVTTDKDDYAPGEYVIITGTGWEPGERVDFTFVETPKPESCVNSHDNFATADASGNIYYDGFLIKINHLGVHFVLTATGQVSGRVAVTEFTDANVKFSTTGLPPNVNVTVSYSGFSPPSPGSAISSSVTFSTGGGGNGASGNIALIGNLNFQFPNTITVLTTVYTLVSTSPTSPATIPATGTFGIEATYIVGKGASTISVNAVGPFTYNSNPQGPDAVTKSGSTGSVTFSYVGVSPTTYAASATKPTNAGSYQVTATLASDANYNGAVSAPLAFSIGKAASVTTVTITGAPFTYTGSSQTPAIVSVTGAGGLSLTPAPLYVNNTNAGTANASYTYTESANHFASSDSKDFTIGKAASVTVVTVPAGPYTFTGSSQTPAIVSVTGAGGLSLTPAPLYVNNTNAGTANASYTYTESANHFASSYSKDFTIGKAASVTVVTVPAGPYTFTGSAQTPATVSVTGAGGLSLTPAPLYVNNTNAGTANASYTYTESANHFASSDSKDFTIGKAASVTVVTVPAGPYTFTGSAQTPATVSVTGAGGLSLTPAPLYVNNTNAGTANASYSYVESANHFGSSDSEDFTIGKAASVTTVTITGAPFTYTGSAITPATVTVTGAGGLNLTPAPVYVDNTNAGTANASYSYVESANHFGSSDSEDFTIGKAASVTTVTITGAPFTYTGSAITPATVTVTGAGGLNLTPAPVYVDNTNAGTANASYSYVESANHFGSSDSEDFTIGKAASVTTVTITGAPFTYTGSAITPATVSVTGAGGLSLTPTANYANNMNAGTATASFTYAESANHFASSDSEDFTIGKAASVTTVTITGAPFTYTGSAITPATVSVTGAGGLSLTPAPVYVNNTNAGTATASYIYAESANHFASSDSEDFTIGKAASVTTVTITGAPFTYTGAAITPATVSVTGAGGLSLTPAPLYVNNTNAGTATASFTYAESANHFASSDSKDFTIGKAASVTVVTVPAGPYTYTGSAQTPASVSVTGAGGLNLTPAVDYANNVNAGTATASYTYAESANYFASSDSKNFTIGKKVLTITADNKSKYVGQVNPAFTVSYSGFVNGETQAILGGTVSYATDASINSCAGSYDVTPTGLTSSNYNIGFVKGTLTVTAVTLDASASSTPVAIGTIATLRATVSPAVSGVSITFYVDGVSKGTSLTDGTGKATLVVSGLAADVYEVKAIIGSGCSESEVVFLPVYDPAGGFVTGGGWIDSPAGAMIGAKATIVGKANFGFNAKYNTGKNNTTEVDGNTNFQFKAGDIHFSSATHDNMQLVISGAKATYTGTGTVNGVGTHKFRVIAIDGDVAGGGGFDKFRIMIWDNNSSSTLLYDNKRGTSESSDDATVIGGGSIVIHKVVAKGNKRVVTDLVTVPWNTPTAEIEKKITAMGSDWFEGKGIKLNINAESYNPLAAGFYEMKVNVQANEWIDLDEPISVTVLVSDKPLPTDIKLSNSILYRNVQGGNLIGDLITIDPADDQHIYSIAEHSDFELVGKSLVWKGTAIPSTARITVLSTDRAGQTIERVLELIREPRFGDFNMFPNPAQSDVNLEIEIYQTTTVGIRIYDAVGRLVHEQEGMQSGSSKYQIAIDHLSPGLYTVQVKTGQIVMNKRLIKK